MARKRKPKVEPHDFNPETAGDFYCTTKDTLQSMANSRGIKDLEKYYQPTDFVFLSKNTQDDLSQAFCQLAFHAQNATLISSIVKFLDNIEFLQRVLCDFNPQRFWEQYDGGSDDEKVNRIVEALKYDEEKTPDGLHWSSEETEEKNKDRIMKSYAKALLYGADYFRRFKTKAEIVQDLIDHKSTDESEDYPASKYIPLFKYFKQRIRSRFSVALTCDFLKEFDDTFHDLPKPDVHIKDTLVALTKSVNGYYDTGFRGDCCCIEDMQRLTTAINDHLRATSEPEITVYRLDRMIWLICSGNFYLDTAKSKTSYLKKVATL